MDYKVIPYHEKWLKLKPKFVTFSKLLATILLLFQQIPSMTLEIGLKLMYFQMSNFDKLLSPYPLSFALKPNDFFFNFFVLETDFPQILNIHKVSTLRIWSKHADF